VRFALGLRCAAGCLAQSTPLRELVLILVNDRIKESVEVGQDYAGRRQIPTPNLLRLKTNTGETMSLEEYKDQIEGPLRKFLDANGGACGAGSCISGRCTEFRSRFRTSSRSVR